MMDYDKLYHHLQAAVLKTAQGLAETAAEKSADDKAGYYHLFAATENAIRQLIGIQRGCEELVMGEEE